MSVFVDQIVASIRQYPVKWKLNNRGLACGPLVVSGVGNTKLLSVAHVRIDGRDMPLTYVDKWRVEAAVLWWHENVSLVHLLDKQLIGE